MLPQRIGSKVGDRLVVHEHPALLWDVEADEKLCQRGLPRATLADQSERRAADDCALLAEVGAEVDVKSFVAGESSLVFVGRPAPRPDRGGACGNADVRPVPQAIWAKSRGNQLSTVALRTVYLCPRCGAKKLCVHLNSGSLVPPDENPAAGWS